MSRILIIEDETPMRTALADVLAGEGYRVLTAADGESGLKRALEEKPDLILLDIMMPKLDGYAVCAELRRLSNPVPILMLTAKGQVEDRVAGLGRRRGRLPRQTVQHGGIARARPRVAPAFSAARQCANETQAWRRGS